jgi:hypothetical protein
MEGMMTLEGKKTYITAAATGPDATGPAAGCGVGGQG